MDKAASIAVRQFDEDAALRAILEGTSAETGEAFFRALVINLAKVCDTFAAWVTEYFPEERKLKALAFRMNNEWVSDYETCIDDTPCEQVVLTRKLVHIPDRLVELYPVDPDVVSTGAVSYSGVPLLDVDGETVLGHLAVIDIRPLELSSKFETVFRIFASRAAAELRRLRAETRVREREEKLSRVVDGAMDAIIELDEHLNVTIANRAAEKVLHRPADQIAGSSFNQFLSRADQAKLTGLIDELKQRPEGERSLWIPGGFEAVMVAGSSFPAEATLSQFEQHRHTFYTLILRNVHDRLEAEEKIRSLTVETEYLRAELREFKGFEEIIGQSEPMQRLCGEIKEVAGTEATVLVLGETGTGKELVARAIHNASPRRDKPLVKVNCAAVPATLIESEFFGHEKGAFTGATEKRQGRFAMADGGTIFLDEIGELPLALQSKLLRVLQEGEFEPVGGSKTLKVNIRVVAATNRDLQRDVHEGRFREDLYYRLNVFPLEVPPLRDRGDDVGLLATAFTAEYARRAGRRIEPPSAHCKARLSGYGWPGNVRELQNVIERAVITSREGKLNLDRALPEDGRAAAPGDPGASKRIRTVKEMQDLERLNLLRALDTTDWRISGEYGAAKLLGMNPSTLASRIKALNIEKPA